MKKPVTNGRVTRWLLLLQEFHITILDKLGKDNVVVDSLSRLTISDDCTTTKEIGRASCRERVSSPV